MEIQEVGANSFRIRLGLGLLGRGAVEEFSGGSNLLLGGGGVVAVDALEGGGVLEGEFRDFEFEFFAFEGVAFLREMGFPLRDGGVLLGQAVVMAF